MSGERALAGKTAFLTGASGGIGSASVTLLARDGAAVVMMGRRMDALEEAKARVTKAVPDAKLVLHAGDAGKEADVKAGIEKAYAIANRLDICVPTVGGGGFSPLLLATADDFRKCFEINVVTTFIAVRYAVPLMEPGGAIVCMSSTAAKLPFAYLPAYHTAKGALENFVRAAAEELGSAGIRINAVRPGLTRSDATGGMFDNPDVLNLFVAEFPLGRAGEPEDIAQAVRYLAGPESSWVTGQSFAVDGGNEIRKNPDLTAMMEHMIGKEKLATVRRGKIPS